MKNLTVVIEWSEGSNDEIKAVCGTFDLTTANEKLSNHASVARGYYKTGIEILVGEEVIYKGALDLNKKFVSIQDELRSEQEFARDKLATGGIEDNEFLNVKNLTAVLENRTRQLAILEILG